MYLVYYAQTAPYSLHHSHTHTEKTPKICVHFSCSILLLDQVDWFLLFHRATSTYIHLKSVSEHLLKRVKKHCDAHNNRMR